MSQKSYISFRRLSQFWDNVKEYIRNAVSPEATKEVFRVLTYADSAPVTAADGDYYINSDENLLYVYDEDGDEWVAVTPNPDSVFITNDTNHMYILENGEYVDITGDTIDNTIYTNNLVTGLDITDNGMYTVCYSPSGNSNTYWYTLTVSRTYGPRRQGRPVTVYYNQVLQNNEVWSARSKTNNGEWSDWEDNTYAYKKDVKKAIKLAKAAL